MYILAQSFPAASFGQHWFSWLLALVSITLGLTLTILSGGLLRKFDTTVNPIKPESTTTLVTSGIYQYSRHPMYLGFFFLLLGFSLLLANGLSILVLALYVFVMNYTQIQPEEKALLKQFGDQYSDYCKTVRRWL